MPIQKLRPSFAFDKERLAQLEQVVPEAFVDGKVNWDTLHEILGEYLEDETIEHFGLSWPGKQASRRFVAQPSNGTLLLEAGAGVNEDSTHNIFIEGENLEVLKLLQKSYAGRIKMIYIDPPYNTGNDLVYQDDFTESLESYLQRTGQLGEAGELLTTNTRAGGRFHSNWLSMMLPRLIIGRTLLSLDGVIFVSINDIEAHYLMIALNEVFGEENFLGTFVWQSKKGGGSDNAGLVSDHEYVICFAKSKSAETLSRVLLEAEGLTLEDDKGAYRLGRELNKWGAGSRREDRPTMYFPVPGPHGEEIYPIRNDGKEGRWRWGKKKMLDIVARGDVEFSPRGDGTYIVYEKIRNNDPRTKPYRTWLTGIGTTADGSKVVKDIFDGRNVMDYPKPVDLIKQLIGIGTGGEDDIILDFFAGSCTTAQATLELNREDGGSRRFICVQLPEFTGVDSEAYKAGYKTLAEVGKERIRRVIRNMSGEETQLAFDLRDIPEDLGFRSYKLGRSNFRIWRDYEGKSTNELATLFDQFEAALVENWGEASLFNEILLLEGFPLDSRIVMQDNYSQNAIYIVESDFHEHRLFVCIDKVIAQETIPLLSLDFPDILVCLDSALPDEGKIQLTDMSNLHVI